jgi:hypothetical protein
MSRCCIIEYYRHSFTRVLLLMGAVCCHLDVDPENITISKQPSGSGPWQSLYTARRNLDDFPQTDASPPVQFGGKRAKYSLVSSVGERRSGNRSMMKRTADNDQHDTGRKKCRKSAPGSLANNEIGTHRMHGIGNANPQIRNEGKGSAKQTTRTNDKPGKPDMQGKNGKNDKNDKNDKNKPRIQPPEGAEEKHEVVRLPNLYKSVEVERGRTPKCVTDNVECLYMDVYVQRSNDISSSLESTGLGHDPISIVTGYEDRLVIYYPLYHEWMLYRKRNYNEFPMYNVPVCTHDGGDQPYRFLGKIHVSLNIACATLRGRSARSSYTGFDRFFDTGDRHCDKIPIDAPIFQAARHFDYDPLVGAEITFEGSLYLDPVAAVQSILDDRRTSQARAPYRTNHLQPALLCSMNKPRYEQSNPAVPTLFDTLIVHLHDGSVSAYPVRNRYSPCETPYCPFSPGISRIRIKRDDALPVKSTVVSSRIFCSELMGTDISPNSESSFDYIRLVVVNTQF